MAQTGSQAGTPVRVGQVNFDPLTVLLRHVLFCTWAKELNELVPQANIGLSGAIVKRGK